MIPSRGSHTSSRRSSVSCCRARRTLCADSHAPSVGALGALAFGCGTTELVHILATQTMAMTRPRSMRIRLDGVLGPGLSAKDAILHTIAQLGIDAARGHAVEFCGTAVASLPLEGRFTLCNMATEMGARTAYVAPDDKTFEWLAGRPFAPAGADWERALAHWQNAALGRQCRVRSGLRDRLPRSRTAGHVGHGPEPGHADFRPSS